MKATARRTIIRPAAPQDATTLARLYRDAVLGTGAEAYDARQVEVWAAFADDLDAFARTLACGHTLLAEVDGEPAAFGQLYPSDHIALLYTASRHARRGLAGALYARFERLAVEAGAPRLSVDASRIARGFFVKAGFRVLAVEYVERQGVVFERFRLEKRLVDDAGSP